MTGSIRKGLLQFIFSGAYMKRWNDKFRPMEMIEIDKQAHKMIIAWMLCRLSGRGMTQADVRALEEEVVAGGIFDYLFRLIITDIKPPILYRIKENPVHYRKLAEWGIAEAEPHLRLLGDEFCERFRRYVLQPKPEGLAAEILGAAHLYASAWEFHLLMRVNVDVDHELRAIDDRFREQLKEYSHLPGVGDLLVGLGYAAPEAGVPGASAGVQTHSALDPAAAVAAPTVSAFARIADLCGQLRFQKRWSQTPRTPETSVMGHMFVVACYAYLLSMSLNACPTRRVNNFFTGLFHDLPELLTRDIISPVKKSFEGLDRFIREYEEEELSRRIFRPLDADGHKDVTARLGYYLGLSVGSEFKECVVEDGQVREVSFEELQNTYNHDRFDPKDGEAVKICDTLAAYIEAYTAMRNGITSDHIQQAFWRMREQNAKRRLGDVHIGALFTDFD